MERRIGNTIIGGVPVDLTKPWTMENYVEARKEARVRAGYDVVATYKEWEDREGSTDCRDKLLTQSVSFPRVVEARCPTHKIAWFTVLPEDHVLVKGKAEVVSE